MKIEKRTRDGVTILDLARARSRSARATSRCAKRCTRRSADGASKILINLKDVTTIDSSGVGELVRAFTTVTNRGGKLKLVNLPAEGQRHPADHAADHRLRSVRERRRGDPLLLI